MAEPFLDFNDVLAQSIEAIEHGQLTDQECLEKYPVYADRLGELLPVVEMLCESPLVEPRLAFKQQSPGRLMAQLPAAAGDNGSFLDTFRQTWQSFSFPMRVPTRRQGLAWTIIITFFATLLVGTGILYAVDTAVPGDPLYAFDRSLEALQLSLDNDPGKVIALRLAQAEERLYEAQTLAALGDTNNMQNALEGYSESIFAASQTVQLAGEGEREGLAHIVDEALPRHDVIIAGLLDDDPDDSEDPDYNYSLGEPDEDDRDEEGDRCVSGEVHPQAQAISKANDVPVEQVMDWFCNGFGFGEIKLAFRISEQTDMAVSELLEQRESRGWGQIMQDAGLIGKKDEKPTGPPDQADKPDRAGPLENKESSKDDKSPEDNGPPDHSGPPENKGSSKDDKSPEDSGTPDPNGKPDHAGQPENKGSSKDDKSPKDNGPPEHNSPSGAEKERNKPEKPPKDKKSEKSEDSKKG